MLIKKINSENDLHIHLENMFLDPKMMLIVYASLGKNHKIIKNLLIMHSNKTKQPNHSLKLARNNVLFLSKDVEIKKIKRAELKSYYKLFGKVFSKQNKIEKYLFGGIIKPRNVESLISFLKTLDDILWYLKNRNMEKIIFMWYRNNKFFSFFLIMSTDINKLVLAFLLISLLYGNFEIYFMKITHVRSIINSIKEGKVPEVSCSLSISDMKNRLYLKKKLQAFYYKHLNEKELNFPKTSEKDNLVIGGSSKASGINAFVNEKLLDGKDIAEIKIRGRETLHIRIELKETRKNANEVMYRIITKKGIFIDKLESLRYIVEFF